MFDEVWLGRARMCNEKEQIATLIVAVVGWLVTAVAPSSSPFRLTKAPPNQSSKQINNQRYLAHINIEVRHCLVHSAPLHWPPPPPLVPVGFWRRGLEFAIA